MRHVFDYQCVKRKVITCEIEKYSTISKKWRKGSKLYNFIESKTQTLETLLLHLPLRKKYSTNQFMSHHPNFKDITRKSRKYVLK